MKTLTLTPGGNILVSTEILGKKICVGRTAKVKDYFKANEPSSYKIFKVNGNTCHLHLVTKLGSYPVAITNHSIDLSLLPFNENIKGDLLTAILFSPCYEMITKLLSKNATT